MLINKLSKQDFITVIAPSSNLTAKNKEDIDKSVIACQKLGLKVKISKHAYSVVSDISEKIEDLEIAFKDKETKAILCAKGGAFCKYLIDKIDYQIIKENPKIFGGVSDATFLLNSIYAKTGLITFHMSDFKHLYVQEYNINCLKEMFINNNLKINSNTQWRTLKPGLGRGTLIGGNLTCLTMLSETDYFPKDKKIILFLEEVQSASSKKGIIQNIDKLKQKNIFDKVKGLLIADYTNDSNIKFEDIILNELSEYNFPIVKCHDFGHNKINCILPIGSKVTLDGFKSKLIIEENIFK